MRAIAFIYLFSINGRYPLNRIDTQYIINNRQNNNNNNGDTQNTEIEQLKIVI